MEGIVGLINLITFFLFGSIWLGIAAFLRLKKGASIIYLLFFTVFYIYLYKVVDYTLLQFQLLLLLKHILPNLILNGQADGGSVQLIPLSTLTLADLKTSLLNILLFVPFGFGLPFITKLRFKAIVAIGALMSIGIEILQLLTGYLAGITFRIADVNDVIFNTLGVAAGYLLFIGFIRTYRHVVRARKIAANPISRYIAERPQLDP